MPAERGLDNETRVIRRITFLAFLLNLGLAGVKIALAFQSRSLAITASVIDSAVDSVASLAVFIGILLSTKKSKNFPLGLYKIENLISVGVAIFIFIAGYEIAREMFAPRTAGPSEMNLSTVLLLAGASGIIFAFGRWAFRVGKQTGSPVLIAEGKHRQIDVLSTLVVVISSLLYYLDIQLPLNWLSIDQIATAVVLVFIVKAGWELHADGMRVLLDASLDRSTLNTVEEIIRSEPRVARIRSLVGRNAGRYRFIQTNIEIRTEDLEKAHAVSEKIEKDISENISHVERVFIHYEPVKKEILSIALPVDKRSTKIFDHFGEAPGFLLVKNRVRSNMDSDKEKNQSGELSRRYIDNPVRDMPKGKGLKIAEYLVEDFSIDVVIVHEDLRNRGPGYVFKNGGVDIHVTKKNDVDEALREFLYPKIARKNG